MGMVLLALYLHSRLLHRTNPIPSLNTALRYIYFILTTISKNKDGSLHYSVEVH